MTLAPPENSEPEAAASTTDAPGEVTTEPTVRPVVRRRVVQHRRKVRRLVGVQVGLTALFVVALVALAFVGWNTALRITGGDAVEVTDPDAPGYVAAVRPTAVTLIAFTGEPVAPPTTDPAIDPAVDPASDPAADPAAQVEVAGETGATPSLATMLLVVERGDGDRTLVPIPAGISLWDFEDSPPQDANDVFASGGIDVLRLRLGADLTFGTTRAVTAPVSMLADLAGAVGPITIALPDDVLVMGLDGEVAVKYAAGPLTLEPPAVAEFMAFSGLDESKANRALREQLVWEALLDAAVESGAELPIPAGSEEQTAAAELIAESFGPTTRFDLVPLSAVPLYVSPPITLYRIDQSAMPTWVASEVPFPVSAFPGQRARVELLNGTADDTALQAVAPTIVGANGEISVTGNAESFDVATSRVEYASGKAQAAAEQIAAALGLSATEVPEAPAEVDVIVVVGTDRLAQG
jgi:hypothetical protein